MFFIQIQLHECYCISSLLFDRYHLCSVWDKSHLKH